MKDNHRYKLDENTPKNPFLLEKVKEAGSVSKLAKLIGLNKGILSLALNNKHISDESKIKIAKYFGKDTLEIF